MATMQEIREANKRGRTFEDARKDEKLLRAARDYQPSTTNPKSREFRSNRKKSVNGKSSKY
ncbi:MAG: hypothetical protein ACRCTF_08695 [Bacteroidales bacterium]